MSSKLFLSIMGLMSLLLMITALPVGEVSAQNGQKEKPTFTPVNIPELGTLYVINFSGDANLLTTGVTAPVSVNLLLNVTGVKTSGVASASLELLDGTLEIGDDTYALSRGSTIFKPISSIDITGANKEVPVVLTAFASLQGKLPISPSDTPVSLVSGKESHSATVQIMADFYSIKYFTGNLRVTAGDEFGELTTPSASFGDKISVSDTDTIDVLGGKIEQFTVGKQMLVQSVLTSEEAIPQDFAYIAQVADSEGFTVQLTWMRGTINPGQSIIVAQSWVPEDSGLYNVQILVWESMNDPVPLTSSIDTLEIEVM
ncbi:MAG: hypothetical protein ACE5KA_05035 [Nitrososphaerales archaeon]